jgi:hypothetical protein
MPRLTRPHLKLPNRRTSARPDDQVLSRGQIIVLFALSLTVLIGIMGLAIDVSYAWVNEMRLQKTADAAALAGAVYLPDDATGATNASLAEAKQNGYVNATGSINGSPNIAISAARNEPNHQQMDVTISAPVPTFFLRLFGIQYLTPSRSAHAQYNLPLPMGSPLNVFGFPTSTDLQGNALNYWAGIEGPCSMKQRGDPYATKDTATASPNCAAASVTNAEYKPPSAGDPGAYDYTIKVPVAGTLSIQLFDPEFCERSSNSFDTGDNGGANVNFNTVFTLYNPSATPYSLGSYTVNTAVSYPGDSSTATNDGQSGATHSCSSYYVTGSGGNYKGQWLPFASIAAVAGSYRLNVQTTTVGNSPAEGSNMYSIKATLNGGTNVSVFGGAVGTMSTMSIYNNLAAGTSNIYLAQINSTNAGKQLVIDLFDVGDVTGLATMYFEMPTSSGWQDATFSYRNSGTTLNSSGTTISGVTSVVTSTASSGHPFNNNWLVVTIQIPPTYTAPQDGWWKIKYVIGGQAGDRTTWNAQVVDIPVHLVPG